MRDSMVYQTFCVHKKHQNLKLNRHSEGKIDIRQIYIARKRIHK